MLIFISGLVFKMIQKVYAAILKILIFRPFLAGQRSKFDRKSEKSSNFDLQTAKNGRKIKIFKIAASLFSVTLKYSPDIKTSLPSAPSLHIFELLCNFGGRFLAIFLQKCPDFPKNTPHGIGRQMRTELNQKKSEPILESSYVGLQHMLKQKKSKF